MTRFKAQLEKRALIRRTREAEIAKLVELRDAMFRVLLEMQVKHANAFFVIESLRDELAVLEMNIANARARKA